MRLAFNIYRPVNVRRSRTKSFPFSLPRVNQLFNVATVGKDGVKGSKEAETFKVMAILSSVAASIRLRPV